MRYFLAVILLCSFAWAGQAVCTPTEYDMLDWMTQNSFQSNYMTGTGNVNPRYEYMEASQYAYYDIKAPSGYPWDLNFYDTTEDGYIYQWATENVWGDPSTYRAFDSTTTMPWAPRCVPIAGIGEKLATITLTSAPYHFYDAGCTLRQKQYDLGYVVNEVWDNGRITVGGNIPPNIHSLALSYRYTCDSTYNNCKYKETFEYARQYGLLRWTYYILTNGVYVQNNQTVHNTSSAFGGGPLEPVHPCWNW
jgi:hypothetical protein